MDPLGVRTEGGDQPPNELKSHDGGEEFSILSVI